MPIRSTLLAAAALAVLSAPAFAAGDENTTSRADGQADAGTAIVATMPSPAVSTRTVVTTNPVVTTSVNGDTTTTTTETTPSAVTTYEFYPYDKTHTGRLMPGDFPAYTMTMWDYKRNGYIDADEWPMIVRAYRPYKSVELRDFAYWDKNHDGRLDPNEVAMMEGQTGLFALYDTKHYGYLDSQEYANARFSAYDTNGDGVIDRTEWMNMPPR